MNIAEQVSVDRGPDVVTDMLGRRPASWLKPFLELAWQAGTVAQVRQGDSPTASEPPTHRVRLGRPARAGDEIVFMFAWTTGARQGPFRRLAGTLVVRPRKGGAVLSLVGADDRASGSGATAMRPAELTARTLLGLLRTALEESPP